MSESSGGPWDRHHAQILPLPPFIIQSELIARSIRTMLVALDEVCYVRCAYHLAENDCRPCNVKVDEAEIRVNKCWG